MSNKEHIEMIDNKIAEIREAKQLVRWNILISLSMALVLIFVALSFGWMKNNVEMFTEDCMDELNSIRVSVEKPIMIESEPEIVTPEYIGEFKVTHYCACAKCCGEYASGYTATGTLATPNHTIAVDPDVIPYGTKVLIDGVVYTAEDCGGGIKGNAVDIFCGSHEEALGSGVFSTSVYLV